ncbi:hypothetical protein F4778DRAFT_59331 [Xylariomycetidae sp. FL2044]|nr:hypothetical protein F4778DRAFT_59331 [Xylariomycetidae sp. FL2044]
MPIITKSSSLNRAGSIHDPNLPSSQVPRFQGYHLIISSSCCGLHLPRPSWLILTTTRHHPACYHNHNHTRTTHPLAAALAPCSLAPTLVISPLSVASSRHTSVVIIIIAASYPSPSLSLLCCKSSVPPRLIHSERRDPVFFIFRSKAPEFQLSPVRTDYPRPRRTQRTTTTTTISALPSHSLGCHPISQDIHDNWILRRTITV